MLIKCQLVGDRVDFLPEKYKDKWIKIDSDKYTGMYITIPSRILRKIRKCAAMTHASYLNQDFPYLGIDGQSFIADIKGEVELYDIIGFDEIKLFVMELNINLG